MLAGTWTTGSLWGGVKEGMVRVGDFGSRAPRAVQEEVLARQNDIAAGRLRPFAGPIQDNRGKLVVAAGAALTDEQILGMDWLAAGVQGKLPQ